MQPDTTTTTTTENASPAAPESSRTRLTQIDSLRGLAALAVLGYHYTVIAFDYPGAVGQTRAFRPFEEGRYGVHLFFMISGFVISLTVDKQRRVADFLFARCARLYPAYWVAVLIAVATNWLASDSIAGPLSPAKFLANLTMFQPAFGIPHLNGSFWTLYVEWLFYGVVAFAMLCGRFPKLHWWLAGIVLLDTLAVFPQAWDRVPGWWRIPHVFPLWRHLYLFVFGMWVYRTRGKWSWWFAAIVLLCLANAYGRGESYKTWLIAGMGAMFILAASSRLKWLDHSLLMGLGKISYSLYLVHEVVGYAIIRSLTTRGFNDYIAVATAAAASLALGIVVNHLVERPAHEALRNWWAKRKQTNAVPLQNLSTAIVEAGSTR